MTNDELEQTKARNRAWLEFCKPQEKTMDELYLQVDDRYERILSIAGDVINTLVDGGLRQHPVEGARIVRWSELPDEARNLSWQPDKPAAATSFGQN